MILAFKGIQIPAGTRANSDIGICIQKHYTIVTLGVIIIPEILWSFFQEAKLHIIYFLNIR